MSTFPGIHHSVDINAYPKRVLRAVQSLARFFYVTRSFPRIEIGNAEYWAILVRPVHDFSIHLNVDREIVVVFSNYTSFEIRTLEAYGEIYAQLNQQRIDRSIRILVSESMEIEGIIQHYLNQNPEYPIIIPISFSNLFSSTTNPLLAAIRRNYLVRDLFGYQNPLREETFFFGRGQVIQNIIDKSSSGQNSSLFGLRKSGKTSSIYAIARKAKSFNFNPVIIDCQDTAVHARDYNGLLSYIISETSKSIGHTKNITSLGDNLVAVSENFDSRMRTILGQAKSNIMLIFDEIESISPETASTSHWNEGAQVVWFWQIIRSFIQRQSLNKEQFLSVVLVGTSPRLLELPTIAGNDNPMYLFAQKDFIPNLEFGETKEMVQKLGYFMGLDFSDELIADLQTTYGGHPFFVRQVCSKVHQLMQGSERPLVVAQSLLRQAKIQVATDLAGYLREIIAHLHRTYPDEVELLKSVLSGNDEEIQEFSREAPELIDHLIGYGIVKRIGADIVEISFSAVEEALSRLFLPNQEDRRAEVSRRRNQLERDIRSALYHWSLNIDSIKFSEILRNNLTNKRYRNLPNHEARIIFSRRDSRLYFSDLMMLIRDQSVLPYLGDRRSTILRYMNTVNRIRSDAHSNDIDDEDMKAVREAFESLELEFLQP